MRKNPAITQQQLADNTFIPRRTVQREIKMLIDNGYLERVGSTKKGEWIVKKYK